MSAYSDWKCGAISRDEYEAAMRRECEDHYPDDVPFYTDDLDDPHWRCENCGHCKVVRLLKPVIGFRDWMDDKGYVHNNPKKPLPQNLYALWSTDGEYTTGNLCEVSNSQVYDDDYCEEFTKI